MTADATSVRNDAPEVRTSPVTDRFGISEPDPGHALLLHDVWIARSGNQESRALRRAVGLAEHTESLGRRPRGGSALIDVIERGGLTGHGGAHRSTAAKWRGALRPGAELTVVANGAESEPISAKDATLMRQRPHLVLDGLALAAEALGAVRAVIWLHGDDDATIDTVREALAERYSAWSYEPPIELVVGPSHYLAGESTAIARSLAGGPTLPLARRRDRSVEGGSRALVQNVETLARVALLARGLPRVDSVLLTVLTPNGREVLEVPRGTLFSEVLDRTGWLGEVPPQAVLLGGFGGMWAPWSELEGATVDENALRAKGLTLGAGVIAPLAVGACGLAETSAIAAYLAAMSARQCGPCLFGLPALAESVRLLAAGTAPRSERVRLIADLRAVAGRGACHHPDGATRLISSAITSFGDDLDAHAHGRPCPGAHRLTIPVPAVAL